MQALLEAGPERELYDAAIERVRNELQGATYTDALKQIASLRPQVDAFFDKVLVNAPDAEDSSEPAHTFCTICLTEFSTIADFSEIVTSGDQK